MRLSELVTLEKYAKEILSSYHTWISTFRSVPLQMFWIKNILRQHPYPRAVSPSWLRFTVYRSVVKGLFALKYKLVIPHYLCLFLNEFVK